MINLLDNHAPSNPRTPNNETPADLARAAGHQEVSGLNLGLLTGVVPDIDISGYPANYFAGFRISG